MMRVRPSIIRLKDSVATESLIPIFQCNGKHVLRSKEYGQLFPHPKSPAMLCSWNSSPITPLLSVEIFVSVGYHHFRRHHHDLLHTSDHFERYRHHQCQRTSHPKREFSWGGFLSKICPNSICKLFTFDLFIIGKQ